MLVNLALRGIEPLRLLAWHLANDGAKIRNISIGCSFRDNFLIFQFLF